MKAANMKRKTSNVLSFIFRSIKQKSVSRVSLCHLKERDWAMAHFLSDVFYAGPFRYLMKSCTASAVDLSCSTVPPAGKHGSLQQLQRRPLWGSARYLAIMCSNYRLKLIKGQLPQHLLTPLALEKHTKTGKPQRFKLPQISFFVWYINLFSFNLKSLDLFKCWLQCWSL